MQIAFPWITQNLMYCAGEALREACRNRKEIDTVFLCRWWFRIAYPSCRGDFLVTLEWIINPRVWRKTYKLMSC
ncbi:hypothetical protein NDU88_003510 [Pleurodeles waltl]|uniref:Uncharacterized protein n=1 Tax=Pleurodeles waltl TaxID=8319 RepID=A0AAV7TNT6_PLEWA|nr:hypothetical protein NDU88_003510 [Pleurodeles waltl]